MVSKCYMLKLLIIKNVKSHLSMWYLILLELLIAVMITIGLISLNRFYVQKSEFVRASDENLYYTGELNLRSVDHVSSMSEEYFWGVNFTLVYTPKGEWQDELATAVATDLKLNGSRYVSQKNFDSYLKKNNIFCGIRFNTSSFRLPKSLNYALVFPAYIRSEIPRTTSDYKSEDLFWQTREMDVGFQQKRRASDDKDIYYSEGFLSVQDMVFQTYLKMLYKQYPPNKLEEAGFEKFPINIEQMPFPSHSDVLSIIKPGTFWVEVIFFVSYMLPTSYLTYVSFQVS